MQSVSTLISVAIAAAALMGTVLFSVREALLDRGALDRAHAVGLYLSPVNKWLLEGTLRREILRAIKCGVILYAMLIPMTNLEIHRQIMVRNFCFVAIAVLLLANSWMDYRVKERAFRELKVNK